MGHSEENEFRYDERVVVVTGAGGGIGRAHALAFAQQGARVVVNDLGVSIEGEPQADVTNSADQVVAEIREQGGEAVANYSSVTSGHEIIEQALDSFGRIDVLINNAAISFQVPFVEMTLELWRKMMSVHLDGTFVCTRAAWPHMQANKYGRIILTSSPTIHGLANVAHYVAAKSAMPGLANALAVEGAPFDIHCNSIAPVALSRIVTAAYPPEFLSQLSIDPGDVAQLAVWLCHESNEASGSIYEVGGGFVAKFRYAHARGASFESGVLTAKNIEENRHAIEDLDEPFLPASAIEVGMRLGMGAAPGEDHS